MKTKIFALLISTLAFAHVEPGTWKGKTVEGQECSMIAGPTYFENDAHHPLNERIKMLVGADEFTVGHPPVVDAARAVAYFNHDLFQGVLPTPKGAKALVVEMKHEEGSEGPTAFTLIENKWKAGEKTSIRCEGLQHFQ